MRTDGRTDRQTDRLVEANSRLSQICESAYKFTKPSSVVY